MPTPTFARYLRAPAKWWADDNPWIVRFGIMGGVCDHCGAGLRRHAIIDTDGQVWGVDCWRTATGKTRREVSAPVEAPRFLRRSRARGWVVWANGREHAFADAIPAELLAQLPKRVQDRHAKKVKKSA